MLGVKLGFASAGGVVADGSVSPGAEEGVADAVTMVGVMVGEGDAGDPAPWQPTSARARSAPPVRTAALDAQ